MALSNGVMVVAKGASVAFALVPKIAFLPPQLLTAASKSSGIAQVNRLLCAFMFCIPNVIFVAIELIRCVCTGNFFAE